MVIDLTLSSSEEDDDDDDDDDDEEDDMPLRPAMVKEPEPQKIDSDKDGDIEEEMEEEEEDEDDDDDGTIEQDYTTAREQQIPDDDDDDDIREAPVTSSSSTDQASGRVERGRETPHMPPLPMLPTPTSKGCVDLPFDLSSRSEQSRNWHYEYETARGLPPLPSGLLSLGDSLEFSDGGSYDDQFSLNFTPHRQRSHNEHRYSPYHN